MAKILCLHGFGQDGLTLRRWTTDLVMAVSEATQASFYFPTANIALSPDNSSDLITIPSKIRRESTYAWNYTYLDWQRQFSGLPEAIAYLKTILEQEGPFDGLLGFSQGAAYGLALTALLEDPYRLSKECGLPLIKHPPFKLSVLFSGCKVPTFRFAPLYREIQTPILLYYCIGDKIIPNRWSMALTANCTNIIVQAHQEGHRIPLDGKIHAVVAAFVASSLDGTQNVSAINLSQEKSRRPRTRAVRCPSDWMCLVEETPFALPRL